MIGVTWINTDPIVASARMRTIIPRQVLRMRGVIHDGKDVVIAAKHGWPVEAVRKMFPKMVMDVCDDHFDSPQFGKHYRDACIFADVVTCNSQSMKARIKQVLNIDAVMIDDPYEDAELEPSYGTGVLWFGHKSNLPDIERYKSDITDLTIISNHNWSPEFLDYSLRHCGIVVIPTGKSMCKSANRAIKAIRYGKYPVCEHLPAYEELGLKTGHLLDGLKENHPLEEIAALQHKIRERFSPDRVSDAWEEVLCGLI